MSNNSSMSPVFKPLNAGRVLQKTGHALPSLKKSIITLKSIYPTHKIIISLDRGQFGVHSDLKLHAESVGIKSSCSKTHPEPPENL